MFLMKRLFPVVMYWAALFSAFDFRTSSPGLFTKLGKLMANAVKIFVNLQHKKINETKIKLLLGIKLS